MINGGETSHQEYEDDDEDSALPLIHRAAQRGDVQKVAEILAHEPGLINSKAREKVWDTPLHLAAWQGHEQVAELLLQHGADVNARGDGQKTPLHYAAEHGNVAVAELLIRHGAALEAELSDGTTPLRFAVCSREPTGRDVADLLVRSGVKLDLPCAMTLDKADLVRTMLRDDPQLVKKLRDPSEAVGGAIALIRRRLPSGVKFLPPGVRPSKELIAQAKRALDERIDILDMVLAQGPPKPIGYWELAEAVRLPTLDVARRLLEYGAETTCPSPGRDDLLDTARKFSACSDEMVALLRSHGVSSPPPPLPLKRDELQSLMANLKSGDPRVRWMAATFLGNYGNRAHAAVPELTEACKDPNPAVATAAKEALRRIETDPAQQK